MEVLGACLIFAGVGVGALPGRRSDNINFPEPGVLEIFIPIQSVSNNSLDNGQSIGKLHVIQTCRSLVDSTTSNINAHRGRVVWLPPAPSSILAPCRFCSSRCQAGYQSTFGTVGYFMGLDLFELTAFFSSQCVSRLPSAVQELDDNSVGRLV